jgi:hypothetical protein
LGRASSTAGGRGGAGNTDQRGSLLGKARTGDVVDGTVVTVASERGADIVSDDVADMKCLLTAAGHRARVIVP